MVKEVITKPSRSFREFRILTGKTTRSSSMSNIGLKTKLCMVPSLKKKNEFFELNIPLISAAMQAVSAEKMAIALAQHGGLSVIPCSIPIKEQVEIINVVKRFKAGFQENVIAVSIDDTIKKVVGIIKETKYNTFPVTDNGRMKGKLLGVIRDKTFDFKEDLGKKVKDFMSKSYLSAEEGITLKEANKKMIKQGSSHLYVVDSKNNLRFVVFKKDLLRQMEYPESTTDMKRRYCVGAAVSTQPKDRERINELLKHGADIIFIDSSDGFSDFQKETLDYIRSKSKKIPVVGGNIITKEGFRFLAESGFNAIKVGMGIGSGCITQEQKGVGRGQATAIMEIVDERNRFFNETGKYIPIISDGGIGNSGQIAIALAFGADVVMMGRFFAQFTESASGIRMHPQLGPLKEYWMEASARARNYGRYETSKDLFFEEGIEGFVSHVGSMYDNFKETLQKIKSAMSSAGCTTIEKFHKNAVVEFQSIASIQDGGIHDIITK